MVVERSPPNSPPRENRDSSGRVETPGGAQHNPEAQHRFQLRGQVDPQALLPGLPPRTRQRNLNRAFEMDEQNREEIRQIIQGEIGANIENAIGPINVLLQNLTQQNAAIAQELTQIRAAQANPQNAGNQQNQGAPNAPVVDPPLPPAQDRALPLLQTYQDWTNFMRAINAEKPVLSPYSGLDYENPERFLRDCERHFTTLHTPEDQRVRVASAALKGDAAKWWNCYENLDVTWQKFQELLRARFDSPSEKTRLYAQLFSQKQTEKEDVALFLQQKYQLSLRLKPDEDELSRVMTLMELLTPEIRKLVRGTKPQDFASLLANARGAEHDVRPPTGTKPKAAPNKEPSKSGGNADASVTKNETTLLPKCWYCPERHFNRDCPVQKARNKTTQENWRLAADKELDAAQDPKH